ncbi:MULTISPECIES: hypothetical protein [Moorena]|uniref:Uncharacterized protein n=1 Tax=Moorena producens 3L TaxID=489825 RepID=F4Y3E4_9CYAN|nr:MULTISPECIES: hypothetical protein [Moorena]EGJ28620.1 hypothetical protein LYNGBM3L_72290 [Moorena producens 3L]NEP64261.1 hypothetical protein [Moorena sp. SIO3A5]NET66102.1 hypothetical protein [Moorena sp. SIO1G6]OLT63715.1 hypothetical protein BI334_00575 [Moorena producens 3L]
MSTVKREEISLYQEAKASLSSLFWQTAQVFTSLLVIFLFAGGKPPGWLVTTSFVVGTVFVFWRENKRTKDGSSEHKQINNNEHKPNKSMVPTYKSYKQRKANQVLRRSIAEKETTIDDQSDAKFNASANYFEKADYVSSEQSYAKQTNMDRDSKIQKWQNYFNFALIIIIFTAPLFTFGIKELGKKNYKIYKNNQGMIAEINSKPLVYSSPVISQIPTDDNPEKTQKLSKSVEPQLVEPIEVENKGIIYNFKNCQKSLNVNSSTQSISCAILITSTKENVQLRLYSNRTSSQRSRLLDQGKEYVATKVEFGTYSSNRIGYVKNSLIKDVPIEAIIDFDGVPLELNQIDILQFTSYLESSYYKGKLNTELRNLPVIPEK